MSKNKMNVETNKFCPFCGEPLFLREMTPENTPYSIRFRFLCHQCKSTAFKVITDKYRVSEVDEKCIIEYIG